MGTRPIKTSRKGDESRLCDTPGCSNEAAQQIIAKGAVQHLCGEHYRKAKAYWERDTEGQIEDT